MEFVEDRILCCMKAEIEFKGKETTLCLTVEDESHLNKTAIEVMESIDKSWEQIQNSIIEELYIDYYEDLYEENIRLSKEQFLDALPILSIGFEHYDCEPSFTIYFGDAQLFGGHCIQVYWEKGDAVTKNDVSLAG